MPDASVTTTQVSVCSTEKCASNSARFQASTAVYEYMRSDLCWDFTDRMVVSNRCFGTTYLSHLPG